MDINIFEHDATCMSVILIEIFLILFYQFTNAMERRT